MSNMTTEQWASAKKSKRRQVTQGGSGHRLLEILKKEHAQIPWINIIQGVFMKNSSIFPLMVLLVSTVEFPPTRCVTQFCRICRDESLFSRST